MKPTIKINTINNHLENRNDIVIPFKRKTIKIHGILVEGVFPIFEGIEIKLEDYYMSDKFWLDNDNNDSKCYIEQMKAASRALNILFQKNSTIINKFTEEQLRSIARGSKKVHGYTWHHKEDWLVMQLVKTEDHKLYRHTGGSYTWNKKYFLNT